jgi:hypothetical protein
MWEDSMEIRQDGSTGNSTSPDQTDEFLQCRMTIVGLDSGTIERDYPEALAKIRHRCTACRVRSSCEVDLKRDPCSPAWEAYCPNSAAIIALAALTDAIN